VQRIKNVLFFILEVLLVIGVFLSTLMMFNVVIKIPSSLFGKIVITVISSSLSVFLTFMVTDHFNKVSSEFQKNLVDRSENYTRNTEQKNFYYKLFGLRYFLEPSNKADKSEYILLLNQIPAVFADNDPVVDAYKNVLDPTLAKDAESKTKLIINLYRAMHYAVNDDSIKFDNDLMSKFIKFN
jgi:hypothetical protein